MNVTIGPAVGRKVDVTINCGDTVAHALRAAGMSADGFQLRLNNSTTVDTSKVLSEGDIVTLVKNNYRGN